VVSSDNRFNRRTFVVGALGGASLLGSAGFLAACGEDDKNDASASDSKSSTTIPGKVGGPEIFGVRSSTDVAVGENRVAFGIVSQKDSVVKEISQGTVKVGFSNDGKAPQEFIDATLRDQGLDGRGLFTVQYDFDKAGIWDMAIQLDGKELPEPLSWQVADKFAVAAPGDKAPTAASPTVADPMGVDPLCTRDPACDFHQDNLADVIGAGKPVVVLFATPALCQTRFCGPVLDLMIETETDFADAVIPVHVEIYKGAAIDEPVVPTVEAWGLPSEPWMFAIDGDGNIKARLDGAFDRAEIRSLFESVAS
jgi:hypothetical protein